MGRDNNLNSLRELEESILDEVIREGELMLAAQFTAAIASDQRAAAWAGFVITLTIASIGATATLGNNKTQFSLAVIAGLFSILLSIAASLAIKVFRPSLFALPGNGPEN